MSAQTWRRPACVLAVVALVPLAFLPAPADDEELLRERPELVTSRVEKSINRGLNWVRSNQNGDGSWTAQGGAYQACMTSLAGMALLGSGSTSTRGPYSKNIARSVDYLLSKCVRSTGLICAPQEYSRSMYGHGFSMLYLASVYGMEQDLGRQARIKKALKKGITLTARSQSAAGGWLYTPDSGGDEGSVTVTQVQALRACRNAGITVPKATIEKAIKYIEKSQQPDGGIAYRVGMVGSRPPITAAAVAVLYNAGEYDSPMAAKALAYCKKNIAIDEGAGGGFWGHYYYSHLYMSQAMYQSGEKDWSFYYPKISKALLSKQEGDGSWNEASVGKIYGTAIALTILQLPYENLPVYGR